MPGISQQHVSDHSLVALRDHMRQRYLSLPVIANYANKARDFLQYIAECGIDLEAVHPDDVESYLHARRQRYRRRHGHSSISEVAWRSRHTGPIHMLLR